MNLPKFRAKLAEKNIKISDLCTLWGRTRQTVSSKVNGKVPIALDEAQKLSDFANLTDEEKVVIFFSNE